MKNIKVNYFIIYYILFTLLILISINIIIKNNIYHGELDIYLPHYLSNIPLKNIIFDPICELDLTRKYFRGREIGSFFNYLDYKFELVLVYLKIPVFISIIDYLSIFIMVILVVWCSKKYFSAGINITLSCVLLLLSSPAILFSGTLYRTNKIIASLGIFLTILFLIISIKNKKDKNYSRYILIYLSALLACSSDEQGLIFTILILLIILYIDIVFKNKLRSAFLSVLLGLLTYIFYIKFLGVWLFEYINGITPMTSGVEIGEIFNLGNYYKSLSLLIRYSSYLFGNIYYLGTKSNYFYEIFYISYLYYILRFNKFYINLKILILILLTIIYISVVIHIMTLKHPAIFWEDIFTYYSLPIIILIFSGFVISINYANSTQGINKRALYLIIGIFIICNISSIRHYKDILRNGHLRYFRVADTVVKAVYSSNEESAKLVDSLKLKNNVSGARSDMNYTQQGIKILKDKIASD
jgi:hypothetical protein